MAELLKLLYELNCEVRIKEQPFDSFAITVSKRGRHLQQIVTLDQILLTEVDLLEVIIRNSIKAIDSYLINNDDGAVDLQ